MSIPDFGANGELLAGVHTTTLEEIETKFGRSSAKRIALMDGLKRASQNFSQSGVRKIWINGSFITSKLEPNDIDGCWEYSKNVNLKKLDPVFLQKSRAKMKAKYGIEFFPAFVIELGSGLPFPKFFQINRDGEAKGILLVKLKGQS